MEPCSTAIKTVYQLNYMPSVFFSFLVCLDLYFLIIFYFYLLIVMCKSQLRLCQLWCLIFSIKRISYSILFYPSAVKWCLARSGVSDHSLKKLNTTQCAWLTPSATVRYSATFVQLVYIDIHAHDLTTRRPSICVNTFTTCTCISAC